MTDVKAPERSVLPYTASLLREAGLSSVEFERAGTQTFKQTARDTETVPTGTVQRFWDAFNAARKAYREATGEGMEAANA